MRKIFLTIILILLAHLAFTLTSEAARYIKGPSEELAESVHSKPKIEEIEKVPETERGLPEELIRRDNEDFRDEDVIVKKAKEADYSEMPDHEVVKRAARKLRPTNPKLAARLGEIARDIAWFV